MATDAWQFYEMKFTTEMKFHPKRNYIINPTSAAAFFGTPESISTPDVIGDDKKHSTEEKPGEALRVDEGNQKIFSY